MAISTAVLVGPVHDCLRLERQLDLLPDRPVSLGWIVTDLDPGPVLRRLGADPTVLGRIEDLEAILMRRRPGLALVSMPAVMADLVQSVRTRLRRMGIADRFMPTLQDQVAGVGPRTELAVDLAGLLGRPARTVDEKAIRSVVDGKTVAITGAGGSIGGELARIVAGRGPSRLLLVERSEAALFDIDRQIARLAPELPRSAILHDVVDASGTREHFRRWRPDVVFHAAAHKHVPMMEDHPASAIDNNLFGTVSAVDAAIAAGAGRFVMISTDKAVNPSSIMGATKRLAELYVQRANGTSETGCSLVRFGNVLGSSGSVLETWSRQLREGGPITVTHAEMTRYFMTIPEAAALVIQSASLLDAECALGEVFVLDMGEPVRILDLARRFVEVHGLAARVSGAARPDPNGPGAVDIVFTGARPGEKLFEELAFDTECMRPTTHPAIHAWTLPPPTPAFVEEMLARLAPARRPRAARDLAALVRGLVPEMTAPVAA